MFLVNEILVFTPGRGQEGLDRLNWIHSLMAPNPGFKQALVAKYLGGATTHTVLRFWEDEAAYLAFRQTPDGNYGRNRPEGLYVNERVVPQWNSIGEASDDSQGRFLVKVQRQVPENAWDAFGQYADQVQSALLAVGGVASHSHFRAKEQSEALAITRFQDRAAFDRFIESSELAETQKSLPEGVGQIDLKCFEIVSEVGPK